MNLNDLSHIPYSELSKELEKGGKFVCYTYTISVIFMTFRRPSQVYFLKSNEWGIKYGWKYLLISLLLGLWEYHGDPYIPYKQYGILFSR